MSKKLLALAIASLALNAMQAQVVINELSAANWSGPTDSFGQREDWIELYNTSGSVVDISGWYISDSQTNNTKYQFEPGTTIAANGRLMVWCSNRNAVAGGNPHPNFKLTQCEGDRAVLSDAGGNIVDNFQFTSTTQVDHSWGRTTDGAATWSLFQTPTPNAANAGAGPYYATKPSMSPAAGYYAGAISVTLSTPDAGATIRYTTNGFEPTAASTAYTGPINVGAPTVIRAKAFSATPGVPPSFVETNTYLVGVTHGVAILSCSGDQAQTLLDGNGGLEPVASMEYFGPDGVLRDKVTGTMNEHGQDSWAYAQRGFDWVSRDQFGYNNAIHYPMFAITDRDEFQRVIVKAAAGDNYEFGPGQPAHIRDPYVHALSQAATCALGRTQL
ncbi:MAG: lamin tail domain-containing protein [Flavobacteriales bacterium]|nr:lamin tail domain-containing protein [Flavobacteriales bacterium]